VCRLYSQGKRGPGDQVEVVVADVVVVVGIVVVVVEVVVVDVVVVDVVVVDVVVVDVVVVDVVDELVVVVVVVVVVGRVEVVEVDDVDVGMVGVVAVDELVVTGTVVETGVVVGEGKAGSKPGLRGCVGTRGAATVVEVNPMAATSSATKAVVDVDSAEPKKESGSKTASVACSGVGLSNSQLAPTTTASTSKPMATRAMTPEMARAMRTLSRSEDLIRRGPVSARCRATRLARSSGLTRPFLR
jgi:hypothetical protein